MAFVGSPRANRHRSHSRGRALRRGSRHEPVSERHLRWLWRAYARGELPDIVQPGLEPVAFRAAFLQAAEALIRTGNELEVLYAHTREGEIPVGLAGIQFGMVRRRRAYPQFLWFREASPRVKLECALRFLLDLKAVAFVVIETAEANWRFFDHLCCYGLLRRAGTLKHAYGEGEPAAIYQSVGQ